MPITLESSVYGKIVSNAMYNDLGRLFDLSLGNGLTTSYRYWGLNYGGNAHYGLLYSIATGSRQNLTYSDYDGVGNIKQMIDGRNSNETINFGYDHLDRLTSASSTLGWSEANQYNSIGNFVNKAGVTYHYPDSGQPRPHAPDWVSNQQNGYGYDGTGNLTSAEGRTYEYDVQNHLKRVVEGGQERLSFVYDGDGALRSMVQSGNTIRYVTPDYRVNVTSGEVIVYYRFGGRAVAYRTYNPNNPSSDVLRYMLSDHLVSSNAEVGQNQAELGQRRTYPFGGSRFSTGDLQTDRLFTGQIWNDSIGLYYYSDGTGYGRFYNPTTGLFTQPDIIVPRAGQGRISALTVNYCDPDLLQSLNSANATGSSAAGGGLTPGTISSGDMDIDPQMLNRYSYVGNNPVNRTDPDGRGPAGIIIRALRARVGRNGNPYFEARNGVSASQAQAIRRRGESVQIFGGTEQARKLVAEQIERGAFPNTKPLHHASDGDSPIMNNHFQQRSSRLEGHTFYQFNPYALLSPGTMADEFSSLTVSNYSQDWPEPLKQLGNVIDFFNPFSDIKDLLEIYQEALDQLPPGEIVNA